MLRRPSLIGGIVLGPIAYRRYRLDRMNGGSLIRRARETDGLTQAQLARRLGITQPSVARLEAAGDNVSLATLQRALSAMGRTLEIRAVQMPSSVDELQIREVLRLTPGERLERHDRAHAEIRAFVNEAGPQVAGMA
jgi:transcriptional regulator with XRE-family HTH domain